MNSTRRRLAALIPLGAFALATNPKKVLAAAAPTDMCFPETGLCVRGRFGEYFFANGGVPVFGFPVSDEFDEVSKTDGKTYKVQYFQRNRFEYHPDNSRPNDVLLGLLGLEELQRRYFFLPMDKLWELYYGKFTTSPSDPGPFVTALNAEFDSRSGNAGETVGSAGGTVPANAVFWTGGQVSGDHFVLANVGGTTVGYARGVVHINTGGRWMRVFGFIDERMMIGK